MEIEVKRYQHLDKDKWDAFVKDAKNGLFMFQRDYMDYHSDRFSDHSLLFYEKNRLIALLPANIAENTLFSHQGLTFGSVICHQKSMKGELMLSIFEAMKNYLLTSGLKEVIYKSIPYIYHTVPAQEDLYALFRSHAQLVRCDIATTINLKTHFKYASGKKEGIRKAIKNKLSVKQSHDWHTYFSKLEIILNKRHAAKPTHNAEEMMRLANKFPENIKLYVTFKEEIMMAGIIIFEYDTVVHCQYMMNTEEGMTIGALDFAVDYVVDYYKDKKLFFDFGISTENNGLYLNKGLISQKEMFGGRSIVHQTYQWIL